MLKVVYFIDNFTSFTNKVKNSLLFDPDNNELIDPKTGEPWFFTMDHYNILLKDIPNTKIIKRTF